MYRKMDPNRIVQLSVGALSGALTDAITEAMRQQAQNSSGNSNEPSSRERRHSQSLQPGSVCTGRAGPSRGAGTTSSRKKNPHNEEPGVKKSWDVAGKFTPEK